MRFSPISLGALLLATTAPAMAQEAAPAPPPSITINGNATLISDYKFRGVSQTDGNFAVQGGATISHVSGFYATFWGSSVDNYVTAHGSAHQEIDLIAGYKHSFKNGVTLDVGALYYVYPGTRPAGDHTSSDFIEPYVSLSYTLGPVLAKGTVNYAPKQKALELDQGADPKTPKQDNLYIAGDFSTAILKTPLSLTAHVGHTFGPDWLAIGKEYTDWSLGVAYTYKALTVGVSYVDTDATLITPSGHDAAKGSILGSIGVSF